MTVTRPARADDAGALGALHVRAWQVGYRGQLPDDYLDALRVEDRTAQWAQRLAARRPDQAMIVAERDGRVVGFAIVGPAPEPAGLGQLYSLNVHPDDWGVGAGNALLAAARGELSRLGFREAVLWVLPANARARRVYEADGWAPDGTERVDTGFSIPIPELRYRTTIAGRRPAPDRESVDEGG